MKARFPKAHKCHDVMLVEIITFNILLLPPSAPVSYLCNTCLHRCIFIDFTKNFKKTFTQIYIYIFNNNVLLFNMPFHIIKCSSKLFCLNSNNF